MFERIGVCSQVFLYMLKQVSKLSCPNTSSSVRESSKSWFLDLKQTLFFCPTKVTYQ